MNNSAIQGLNLDLQKLRSSIQEEYSAVAKEPERGFHFHTGRKLADMLGYHEEWLAGIPFSAIESMAGTGNPFSLGELKAGEYVVDCGSGAGADSLIAARMVGPTGRVVGVDMTPEMLSKAKRNAFESGMTRVEFREGYLESLPIADDWADVIISNGVLNLVPDKDAALREMYRVLKPGGRLQLADIALQKPVPEGAKNDVTLWTGCIAGGLLKLELEQKVLAAGFKEVEVIWGKEVFDGVCATAGAFAANSLPAQAGGRAEGSTQASALSFKAGFFAPATTVSRPTPGVPSGTSGQQTGWPVSNTWAAVSLPSSMAGVGMLSRSE